MNHRIVLSTTGTVLYIEAAMMLIPLLIAMGFKEHKQALAFLAAILIATAWASCCGGSHPLSARISSPRKALL